MTDKQKLILDKSYAWIFKVVETQQRFIDFEDLWIAYPFKTTGMTKEELKILYDEMKKEISIETNLPKNNKMEETKVIWKDTTSYSRDDKERKQTCWTYKNGDLEITVVNAHRHFPENWVLHCYAIGYNTAGIQLSSIEPVEKAQKMALWIVRKRLTFLLNCLPVEKPNEPSSEETLQGHFKPDAE